MDIGPVDIVIFHMNGCPHCEAVTGMQGIPAKLRVPTRVWQLESAHKLCRRLGVRQYPTIMALSPNAVIEYEGPRTPDALDDFLVASQAFDPNSWGESL